ncbi:MAG: hypothetical protein IPJ19_14475 [Planctomycetes bacterium]|nr:hypothetical protein [Planctomycetota bacterium]
MNRDFSEMLAALCGAGAEFLVVGAHALAAHGRPRATGDLDLWVRPTKQNALLVWQALTAFGAPLAGLKLSDLSDPDVVFQMGVPPNRIDILTAIDGVEFESAWKNRIRVKLAGLEIPVLGRDDLLANKRAAGRPKDLADVAWLESKAAP